MKIKTLCEKINWKIPKVEIDHATEYSTYANPIHVWANYEIRKLSREAERTGKSGSGEAKDAIVSIQIARASAISKASTLVDHLEKKRLMEQEAINAKLKVKILSVIVSIAIPCLTVLLPLVIKWIW